MKKLIAASIIAIAGIGAATMAADAAQGCGPGWHRNGWGTCVRNVWVAPVRYACGRYWHWSNRRGRCVRDHAVVYVPPPPPPRAPVYQQTITAPARTGLIPGSAKSAHSVCAYNYHPNARGDCVPN